MITSETESMKISLPRFLGKTYYFVIYQGENCKTISEGDIPENGRIIIKISQKYNNYKGRGRMIIYNHACEVASLEVYIPEGNFSIHCESIERNKKDTIQINNKENEKLNELSEMHDTIVNRYLAMRMAVSAFSQEDKNYDLFKAEYNRQKKLYKTFQAQLERNNDDVSKFLQIDSISKGQSPKLFDSEYDKADNTADYIVNSMDWNILYTSGCWVEVIDLWIRCHTVILRDQNRFHKDYKKISLKLESKLYQSFRNRILYNLKNQQGKDEWYRALSENMLVK